MSLPHHAHCVCVSFTGNIHLNLFDTSIVQEQDFAALHFSKLTGSRSDSGHTEQKYVFGSPECAKHEAMKLACHRANIFVDEHQCNPRGVYLYAGGSVQIAVRSGPPQSFRVTSSLSHDIEETPSVAAGQKHDW